MRDRSLSTAAITAVTILLAVACGRGMEGDSPGSDGDWRGTIETEGDVTTVVNESGSVWGGTARLVEETSIGVDAGADEYMFGLIESVHATDDRIYVVDSQVPAVRVYDHEGNYLENLGGPGEGPGEYVDPGLITAGPDGRLFLMAFRSNRILVYAPDGSLLESWPSMPSAGAEGSAASTGPMVFSDDGVMWVRITEYGPRAINRRYGIQAHGPEGLFGPRWYVEESDLNVPTTSFRGRETPVPFAPRLRWALVGPATLVRGTSDRYRFEFRREGRTVRVVEKSWEPIPVDPDRLEWTRRLTVASRRAVEPDWEWNGPPMPEHLPAFSGFLPTSSGELWVVRELPAQRQANCVEDPLAEGARAARENPCWQQCISVDAFADDGRYLGEVELPPNLRPNAAHLFVRDRLVVAALVDDAGVPVVKRYRLAPPERGGS